MSGQFSNPPRADATPQTIAVGSCDDSALPIANPPIQRIQFVTPRIGLPPLRGIIDRRILLNFRCDPAALARLTPYPFRPKLVNGWGLAGVCLLRLRRLRPVGFPAWVGVASENASHRIAVEWDSADGPREGVYITRRDTASTLNRLAGGRIFPGAHRAAAFQVRETRDAFEVEFRGATASARVHARCVTEFPGNSAFPTLAEASEFFRGGSLGWSPRAVANEFDGLELRCPGWRVEPLAVDVVESSLFADRALFPAGSVEFDSALLMRNLPHEWRGRGTMIVRHA